MVAHIYKVEILNMTQFFFIFDIDGFNECSKYTHMYFSHLVFSSFFNILAQTFIQPPVILNKITG